MCMLLCRCSASMMMLQLCLGVLRLWQLQDDTYIPGAPWTTQPATKVR